MMMHNMVYWTAKQLKVLNDASTVVVSGKQINKPSDDPTAVRQIQEDHTEISADAQYTYNLELAQTWINISDTTLTSVYSLLEGAQEAVSSVTSSDASNTALIIKNIYQQALGLANSFYGTSYMYSGNLSDTRPFITDVKISAATAPTADIAFDLARAATDMTIEIMNSSGDVVRTLAAGIGVENTNTVFWDGLNDDGDTVPDGDYTFTVSATDTSGVVASYPTYRGDAGGKEFVSGKNTSIVLNNNGSVIFGSSLKALSQIITALENSSTTEISTTDLSTAIAEAMSGIENQEVALANAGTLVTNATDRIDKLTTCLANRISALEVGSVEEASIKLTAQETAYEVAISANASILNMAKLSDYL